MFIALENPISLRLHATAAITNARAPAWRLNKCSTVSWLVVLVRGISSISRGD